MSVPQMPVLLTRIRTSSGPISGTGRVSIHVEAGFGGGLHQRRISFVMTGLRSCGLRPRRRRAPVEVGAGEGGVHLGADAGAAMGHDGEEEARDIDAFVVERGRHVLRQPRLAQHDGHDRVFAGEKVEAEPLRARAPVACVVEERGAEAAIFFHKIDRRDPGGADGRRQGVGEEVGPRPLAQQVDDGLRPGDVTADGAAERLAERAGEDMDLVRDAEMMRRAAPLGPMKPVAWQSSTMTTAS
jgi:hypothetical protein